MISFRLEAAISSSALGIFILKFQGYFMFLDSGTKVPLKVMKNLTKDVVARCDLLFEISRVFSDRVLVSIPEDAHSDGGAEEIWIIFVVFIWQEYKFSNFQELFSSSYVCERARVNSY